MIIISFGHICLCMYLLGHICLYYTLFQEDVDLLLDRLNKLPSDPDSVIQLHEYEQQEGMQFVNWPF